MAARSTSEAADMPQDSAEGRNIASPVKLRLVGRQESSSQQDASSGSSPMMSEQQQQQHSDSSNNDEQISQHAVYPASAGFRSVPATPEYRSRSAMTSPSTSYYSSATPGATPRPPRHDHHASSSYPMATSPREDSSGIVDSLAAPAEVETPKGSAVPGSSSSRQHRTTSDSAPTTPMSASREGRTHRSSKSRSHRSEKEKTSSAAAAQLGTLTKSTSSALLTASAHSSLAAHAASTHVSKDVKYPSLPSAVLTPQNSIPWSISRPYWSKTPAWGKIPNRPMRAHTATLVETKSGGGGMFSMSSASLWAFGGCDAKTTFRDMWKLDLQTFQWSKPKLRGAHPPSLRAHSATYIPPFQSPTKCSTDGHILYFGGGDGPSYFNDIYLLNLKHNSWSKPQQFGTVPVPRRAHTAVWYEPKKWLVVVGGGNGSKALNDTYVLECKNMDRLNWRKAETKGTKPKLRGYHTMNLIGDKAIIFGGSDGTECFSDVFILQLANFTWTQMSIYSPSLLCPRLSHTATLLSPTKLLILGGHDGTDYASSLVVLNLETWKFEEVPHSGLAPSKRGYHSANSYDGRVILLGGFDGKSHFDDAWTLDIGAWTALSR